VNISSYTNQYGRAELNLKSICLYGIKV